MKKVLLIVLSVVALVVIGVAIYVNVSWDRDLDAEFPDIKARGDSASIARGEYLVYGPAHCAYCHVPPEQVKLVAQGQAVPLIGGWEVKIPPGTFRATNITPDIETGIGGMSDQEFARALRFSVSSKNKFMLPVMEFQEMSDEDIASILSYLRAQEPVHNPVPTNEYSFLGKALLAFGMIKPDGPKYTPPVSVAPDSTVLYGDYISNNVANCLGCHTNRDLKTGGMAGPPYAGGFVMDAEGDPEAAGYRFIAPNITPDNETGIMYLWSEQDFIVRFKEGRLIAGSPMPWEAYARMNELELKALYRYLQTVDAHRISTVEVVLEPGDDVPDVSFD